MRRPRAAGVALAAAAACVAVAFVAARTEPSLVVLAAVDAPGFWVLAAVPLLGLALWLFRPRRLVAVVAVVAGLPLAAFALYAVSLSGPADSRVVARTTGDGGYELRLVESAVFLDPWWEVRVRSRRGLLSREACVLVVTPPDRVREFRFAGPHTVEVVDSTGARHVVAFDPDSLRPERPC